MGASAILAIKIISDASKAGAGFDQTTQKVSKLSKAGQVAGTALKYGFLAAAAGGVAAARAASSDADAAAKLATNLKNATGATDTQVASVEKWITAQGKALGVTDDELRPAISKLAAATGSVTKAQKLASLAMDISAARGVSLATVTSALEKAQNGSLGGLSRLGVKTKNAAGETKSLAAVQKNLATLYGGAAAKAADTNAGRQKILQTRMGELAEKIGTGLLPVMERLTDIGIAAADWMSKHTNTVLALVAGLGALLAIVKAVSLATDIASAATKIWAAGQWLLNIAMDANPIALIIIAVIALVAAIVIAYKKSETFRKIVQAVGKACAKAFQWVIDKIGDLVNWVKSTAPKAFAFLKNAVILYFKIMTLPLRTLIDWISKLVGWVKDKAVDGWNRLKAAAVAVWDKLTGGAQNLIDKVRSVIGWVREKLGDAFGVAKDAALAPIDAIRGAFQKVMDVVRSIIGFVEDLINKIKDIDLPDLPDIPFLGKIIPGSSSSSVAPAAPTGGDTYQITVQGAVDPNATAVQLDTLLARRARRVGNRVVIA